MRREKSQHPEQEGEKRQPKAHAVLTYMNGLTKRLHRAYRKDNVNLYSKTGFTARNAVVCPKDFLDTEEQCGVNYECESDVCGEAYVKETERSLTQRVEEHAKLIEKGDSKSALSQHQETIGHLGANKPVIEKMKMVEREARKAYRKVKESIYKLRGTSAGPLPAHTTVTWTQL